MINVSYIRQIYRNSLAEFENHNKELMGAIQKEIISAAKSCRDICKLDFTDTGISEEDVELISQILKQHNYQVIKNPGGVVADSNMVLEVSW